MGNRRLLRAVSRRTGIGMSGNNSNAAGEKDDHSVGSNDDDVRILDANGEVTRTLSRRPRENIMSSMPPLGTLSQTSPQHLDLLYALAYPNKVEIMKELPKPVKAPICTLVPGTNYDNAADRAELDGQDLSEREIQKRQSIAMQQAGFQGPLVDGAGGDSSASGVVDTDVREGNDFMGSNRAEEEKLEDLANIEEEVQQQRDTLQEAN